MHRPAPQHRHKEQRQKRQIGHSVQRHPGKDDTPGQNRVTAVEFAGLPPEHSALADHHTAGNSEGQPQFGRAHRRVCGQRHGQAEGDCDARCKAQALRSVVRWVVRLWVSLVVSRISTMAADGLMLWRKPVPCEVSAKRPALRSVWRKAAAVMQDFAQALKHWRRRRRPRQLQLATEAEVSSRRITFLGTGRACPSQGMVLRLAGVLGLPRRAEYHPDGGGIFPAVSDP